MSYNIGSGFDSQRWYEATLDRRTREALEERIAEYGQAHENDSNAALLDQLRERAAELGYVPYAEDCLAGRLLIERFGSWTEVLRQANLPNPKGSRNLRNTQLYQAEYKRQQKLHRQEKEQKLEKRKAAEQERQKRKEDRSQPPE